MYRSSSLPAALVLAAFGTLSIFAAATWTQYSDWNNAYQLTEYGQSTYGRVIGCEERGRDNAQYLIYRYEAIDLQGNQASYETEERASHSICETYPRGSDIGITYSKKNPRIAQIGTEVTVYPLASYFKAPFLIGVVALVLILVSIPRKKQDNIPANVDEDF